MSKESYQNVSNLMQTLNLDYLVVIDFETYYKSKGSAGNKSYSLRNNTYFDYIFDDRFEVTGLSYLVLNKQAEIVDRFTTADALQPETLAGYKANRRVGLCAANTQFDASILAWRYGITFDYYLDVLLMRKLLCSGSASLKAAAIDAFPDDERYRKGGEELADVDGVPAKYMSDEQRDALLSYCEHDTLLALELLEHYLATLATMSDSMREEVDLMHITLRAAIEPQFRVDLGLLAERIEMEKNAEQDAINDARQFLYERFNITDATKTTFSSNKQFAELLKTLSLPVPIKISKTTKRPTDALGVSDPEFVKLTIDFPDFAPVFDARKAVKSTNALTRAESFIRVSKLFKAMCQVDTGATMPFFLNYWGAGQTGRWSGGQKLNQQNLEADRSGDGTKGHHRRSLLAVENHVIAVSDLSNIELRVNMWLCGQTDILEQMKQKGYDYYCDVATPIFGYDVIKGQHKAERQMGKASALGLGFSMGWRGFQNYLRTGPLGMEPMYKDDKFCQQVKYAYESKHPFVVKMWQIIDKAVIPTIINGGEFRFGPNDSVIATKDTITLPSGRKLRYPNARWEGKETRSGVNYQPTMDGNLTDRYGNPVPKTFWHGLIIENIVQAIARDVLGYQLVRIHWYLEESQRGWLIGSVHDESLSMINSDTADDTFSNIQTIMSQCPPWAEGIPLDNEGGYAPEYSK